MSPPVASSGADPDGDGGTPLRRGPTALARRLGLARRFGVDARGLAAFRIALGALVVADLLFRARELRVFYTDAGVLSRAALAELSPTLARVSLHTITGSTAGQAALFVLAGCLAAALAVGYRTRLATAGVAILHASLYARNPYLMNGGDALLVLALFLAVFLPLGERWSLDAARAAGDGPPRERIASLATATLLVQLVVVYLANAAFKLQSDPWMSGNAVQYVLELEQYSVGIGPYLTAYPDLLVAVNWLWVAMLVGSPLLLLAVGRLRTVVVAGFAVAHLGMLATMRLGLFPLVVCALLFLYLPTPVWDHLERWLGERRKQTDESRLSVIRQRLEGRLASDDDSRSVSLRGRLPPSVRRGSRAAVTVFLAVVLVASVLWPATAVGVVDASKHDAVPDPDGYTWTLFAPHPPTSTRWFVAPTTLESGERIDAIDGSSVEWDPPSDAADTYPSTLWHRYLADVRWGSDAEQERLAAYLCREAGSDRGSEATEVAVYVVEQRIEAAGGGPPERTELVRMDCSNAA